MKALRRWFHNRQRRTDLQILWPALKAASSSIEQARVAFFMHCADDPAWQALYSPEELAAYIDTLE